MRGCERRLTLTETGDHGKQTASIPFGPSHTQATAQATDVQQSEPRPPHHMQHTLDELLGLKSKNRPRGLEEGYLNEDGLLSVVLAVSILEVLFGRGTPRCLPSMIVHPRQAVLPEEVHRWWKSKVFQPRELSPISKT